MRNDASPRTPPHVDHRAALIDPSTGHTLSPPPTSPRRRRSPSSRSDVDVDVLVANAGLPASGALEDYTRAELERALRVNLSAPIRPAHELVPRMLSRGRGHIVLISSLSAKAPTALASLYCATKFGLRGFGLALREDLRGSGVGVSVVMLRWFPRDYRKSTFARNAPRTVPA